ncbi:MAG: YadA-like family protein [Cetobacterium sp.]
MKENIRTILCGCFKKKITITQSILVGFLITGSMAMASSNKEMDNLEMRVTDNMMKTLRNENIANQNKESILNHNIILSNHEARLNEAEETLSENSNQLDKVTNKANENSRNIVSQDKILAKHEKELSGYRDYIGGLKKETEDIIKANGRMDEVEEKVSDVKMDIKSLKGNKADAVETKASLDKLSSEAAKEHSSRLSNEKELSGRVSKANEKLEKHDVILNGMKDYINGLTERTEAQETAIEANDSKITKATETLDNHEDRLRDVEMTGEENQEAVNKLLDDTASINKKLIETTSKSLSNEERIEKTETKVSDLDEKMSDAKMDIKSLKGNKADAVETKASLDKLSSEAAAEHKSRLSNEKELAGRISKANATISNHEERLANTEIATKTNEEKISSLDEKMSDAKMDIKSLKGNKADAAETKASLDKLNSEAAAEHKSRLSNEKELAGRVSKTEDKTKKLDAQVAENKDNIEYQRQAIVDVAVIATKNKETLDKTLTKHTDAIEDHENRLDSFAVINNNQDKKDKAHDQMDAQHTKNIDDNKKSIDKNTKILTNHETRLVQQDARIADNQRAISNLNSRMDNMDSKVNKGMSLMAAMTAIDFQSVDAGEVGIGAGVGHYANCEGVAIGVAYAPTNSFRVNARYSVSTADIHTSAVGVGATYKFKVR